MVAVAVAVVFAVAGCSAGNAPSASLPSGSAPPQSSSPTSNPPSTAATTPPPTEPPLPATATQDTPAGAQSFARYWLSVLDYAYKTGNTQPFRALGRCAGCISLANSIQKVYTNGGSVSGGDLKALRTRVDRYVDGAAAAVELFYSRSQRVVLDGKGGRFVDPAASNLGFLVVLDRTAASWQIDRFPVLEK